MFKVERLTVKQRRSVSSGSMLFAKSLLLSSVAVKELMRLVYAVLRLPGN